VGTEYRSAVSFLGLPLLHVRWSTTDLPLREKPRAVGWLAIGDRPVGVIACGTISFGVISFGAFAGGLVAFGGLACGVISYAGLGLGIFVSAGLAIGWEAHGGMALALHLAYGGVAMARDLAIGGIALAAQANNTIAEAAAAQSHWIMLTRMRWFPTVAPVIVGLMLVMMIWISSRKLRRGSSETPQP
jgi:hypothetical protein